jgi:hypothetical protein
MKKTWSRLKEICLVSVFFSFAVLWGSLASCSVPNAYEQGPLEGRKFTRDAEKDIQYIEFNKPDYILTVLSNTDTTYVVYGVYEVYKAAGRDRLKGTVLSTVRKTGTTKHRDPFDVELVLGYEAILIDGVRRWREVIRK